MGRDKWSTRPLVEDCLVLDIGPIVRSGALEAAPGRFCTLTWTFPGGQTKSIGFTMQRSGETASLRLVYSMAVSGDRWEQISYDIQLSTTRCHFGGIRWWFRCPALKGDGICNRRSAKLYLPPGGRYFACRLCYNLTYRSCRERNPQWDWIRKLSPEQLSRLLSTRLSALNQLIREGR